MPRVAMAIIRSVSRSFSRTWVPRSRMARETWSSRRRNRSLMACSGCARRRARRRAAGRRSGRRGPRGGRARPWRLRGGRGPARRRCARGGRGRRRGRPWPAGPGRCGSRGPRRGWSPRWRCLAHALVRELDAGADAGRLAVGDGEILVEFDVDDGEEVEAGLEGAELADEQQRGDGGRDQDEDHERGDPRGEAVAQAQRRRAGRAMRSPWTVEFRRLARLGGWRPRSAMVQGRGRGRMRGRVASPTRRLFSRDPDPCERWPACRSRRDVCPRPFSPVSRPLRC
jgi:hypothetical protein